nr:MAG TPA: hypothetical protein [Caudoviricetes sp.]
MRQAVLRRHFSTVNRYCGRGPKWCLIVKELTMCSFCRGTNVKSFTIKTS